MRIVTFVDTDQLTESAKAALEFAGRAKELGREVIVVGLVRTNASPGLTPFGKAADESGIPFRLLQQRRPIDPGVLGQFEIMLRKLRPDVFQSHEAKGMLLYRISRWKPRIWQAFLHPGPGEDRKSGLRRIFERRLLRGADQVIIESRDQIEAALQHGARQDRLLVLQRNGPGDAYWIDNVLSEAERLTRR